MPEMSRRRFFGLLGGVVATAVAPPIYVLPPAGGWRQGYFASVFDPSRHVIFGGQAGSGKTNAMLLSYADDLGLCYKIAENFYTDHVHLWTEDQSVRLRAVVERYRREWLQEIKAQAAIRKAICLF